NFSDVVVIASKQDYAELEKILTENNGETTIDQRRIFATKAFNVCTAYDIAISNYFNKSNFTNPFKQAKTVLRYGENPHQEAAFYGEMNELFDQLNGKELSYNNLVDVDAAINLIADLQSSTNVGSQEEPSASFAIIKHTNVCGIALRPTVFEAWQAALQSDPESAFGGVLITASTIDKQTAFAINEIFFEVLIAPFLKEDALQILQAKKNRIILQKKQNISLTHQYKSVLNGTLTQQNDAGNFKEWKEVGGRVSVENERKDLKFANIICKHLKSNAIALVKDLQLIGKGCGQTSRIDALRQAIEKANQFNFDLTGAALASDAFFPFNDCVK
ncbi:MAG: bifunctional phosphoribosylaminoimidazolecarboxamide formyltransferase/IMP cyclohydrolase PurH, partial [Chitinophagaceae bacterium]